MSFASDEQYDATLHDAEDEQSDSPSEAMGPKRWYAVQVASGCEKRVKLNLEQRIQTLDVADRILRIEIPETPVLKPQKSGRPKESTEKVFPGYVLVQLQLVRDTAVDGWKMDDEAWQTIKNTPNVINFVGSERRPRTGGGRGRGHVQPLPLSRAEVERIFKQAEEQKPVVKVDMATGDKITVLSGPFKDFEGEVIEVSPERSKLKALLSIFGRDTPVELEFNQVQKES
ncbi:MAG: transcription termination/antitermination protein NusG [Thainema sp.]